MARYKSYETRTSPLNLTKRRRKENRHVVKAQHTRGHMKIKCNKQPSQIINSPLSYLYLNVQSENQRNLFYCPDKIAYRL